MKVVILCGGRGTRLREETEFRPKPMVPIGGRPVLWHIMKFYAHFGFSDFVLCLGYKGDMIKDYFRNYLWNTCDVTLSLGKAPKITYHEDHDEEHWTVTLADTGLEALTGTRIKRIQRYIPRGEDFFLTYGDGLCSMDLRAALACHREAGKHLTITAVHPAGRFGAVNLEPDGAIHRFEEKPQMEEFYVNGGFMVCSHSVFDYLDDDEDVMFEMAPMKRIVADGQMNAYRHEGFWQPMDTFQESQYLNRLWNEGKAPWKLW